MKLSSTIAAAAAFLLGSVKAVDFDFFDLEGYYSGGFLSVAVDPRPPGSDVGLNMLLKCEEGSGFNGNNCDFVLRGPDGFSLCNLVDQVADPPGEGTVFTGKIAENQFDADTGVAKFSILSAICAGEEVTEFTVQTPRGPVAIPFEAAPVTLQMVPGASNKHVKSLKFTIASTDPEGSDVVSNFYKIAGGFKSS